MLRICTHTIGFVGLVAIVIGLTNVPIFLLCGTLLLVGALIAASIQSVQN